MEYFHFILLVLLLYRVRYFFIRWVSVVLLQLHIVVTAYLEVVTSATASGEPQRRSEGSRTTLSRLHRPGQRDSSLFVWPAMRTSSVFCLWCPQARGQVSDRRSLCTALCPLPASYREAALCCYMEEKQIGRDTKPLTPRLWQRGREAGSSSVFPAVDANWSG